MTPAEANILFGWGRSSSMFTYYSSMATEEIKLTTNQLQTKEINQAVQKRPFTMNIVAQTHMALVIHAELRS